MQSETSIDVLVIGGGPAGSTAASELTQRGYRVVLLEKARHPRFHIGESLLPANLPLLERLGVADRVRAIGMKKNGAEFVSPTDGREQVFEFAEAWNKSIPFAYQVRRSQFDEILIRRAAELGAEVIEGCRVREVQIPADGSAVSVDAEHEDGRRQSWRARYLIDASGRDTFLANRFNSKRRNKKHNSAAIYGHFRGARRNSEQREGNITIFWFDHGWFWFIPLYDGITSVGAVAWPAYMRTRTNSVRDFFMATIALCPPLAQRLANAELVSPVTATGNYSYSSNRSHGKNYLIVGDAFAFIDPVFSSGVMLAMNSAMTAADTVDICVREPRRANAALKHFDRVMRHGPREFSWFIYRVTKPTMREMFLGPRNVLRMKEALLSVLAGDIFGRTPFWASLRAFKALYFIVSALNFRRSISAYRKHRADIRPDSEPTAAG